MKEFAPGAAITVKFPQRFLTSDGMGYAPQGINRISTTVSLDQWIQIAFEWDNYARAVKLERSEEDLRENYLDPAAAAMAQEWDNRCANFAHLNTSQVVGALRKPAVNCSSTPRMAVGPFRERRDDELKPRPCVQDFHGSTHRGYRTQALSSKPNQRPQRERHYAGHLRTAENVRGVCLESFVMITVPRLMHVENGYHQAGDGPPSALPFRLRWTPISNKSADRR